MRDGPGPTGRPAPEFALPKGLRGEAVLKNILENLEGMDKALAELIKRDPDVAAVLSTVGGGNAAAIASSTRCTSLALAR